MRARKRMLSTPVMPPWKPPEKPRGQETLCVQRTSPWLARTTPPRILISVDLPWPLRPRMARRPLGSRSNERSLKSSRISRAPRKRLARSRTSSIAAALDLPVLAQAREHQHDGRPGHEGADDDHRYGEEPAGPLGLVRRV